MNGLMEQPSMAVVSSDTIKTWTDEELLEVYRDEQDRNAFEELVRRYERELYNYLRRYLNDAEMAEDAFQATFLKVHLKCDSYESGRPSSTLVVQNRHEQGDRLCNVETNVRELIALIIALVASRATIWLHWSKPFPATKQIHLSSLSGKKNEKRSEKLSTASRTHTRRCLISFISKGLSTERRLTFFPSRLGRYEVSSTRQSENYMKC